VEKYIRTLEVSSFVSPVATISQVRAKLVEQQQYMGEAKGVVMDGRDIGTVVFPTAELKIFMTASAEERAKRRYQELLDRGDEVQYKAVLANVIERDEIDTTRKDSPLDTTTSKRPYSRKSLIKNGFNTYTLKELGLSFKEAVF